ncbi:hypothetical protein [Synechococcus sp. UW179A]|uniref:hypothetical protein n=1 Tax=Synechococcus sp. UW179A TaxID=2575510 RepID=UPI001FCC45F8|nr:hypothetical protein [Synechococcus sp. UW179A]
MASTPADQLHIFPSFHCVCRSMRLWLCGTGGWCLTQRYELRMTTGHALLGCRC